MFKKTELTTQASKSRVGLFNECTYWKLNCYYSNITIKIRGQCQDVWSAHYPTGLALPLLFDLFRKRKHYLSRSSEIKPSPFSCLYSTFHRGRWRRERGRERECGWKKHRQRLRWTNISVNAKSAGFILKQSNIFIVICAAHFIMLVLDEARWECRAALDEPSVQCKHRRSAKKRRARMRC